ncbi:hypothetical protein [Nocardia sp. NPDC003183]
MTDFGALRRVSSADVYKSGRLAAALGRTADGGTEFRYVPEYSGDPIASTSPLGTEPITGGSGSVPPPHFARRVRHNGQVNAEEPEWIRLMTYEATEGAPRPISALRG